MKANLPYHVREACKNNIKRVDTGFKHADLTYRQTPCSTSQAAPGIPPSPPNGQNTGSHLPGRPGRHPLLCVPVRFRPRLGNTAHAGMDSFHLRLGGIADFHSVVELPVGLAAQDGRTAGAPDRQKGCGSGRPPAGGHWIPKSTGTNTVQQSSRRRPWNRWPAKSPDRT